MLKGVNKQVLEIKEAENDFFEKAIFFVKPEYSGMSEGRLREKAREEFLSAGAPPKGKILQSRKQKLIKAIGLVVLGIAIGAVFASLI